MKICIMDVSTGTVTFAILPEGIGGDDYVYEILKLKSTNVDWMEIDTIDGLDDFINGKEKEI